MPARLLRALLPFAAALALALALALAAPAAAQQTDTASAGWYLSYGEATDPAVLSFAEALEKDSVFQFVAGALDAWIRVPRDVTVGGAECKAAYSYHDPAERWAAVCYELGLELMSLFASEGNRQVEGAMGALVFLLLHQTGHVLMDVLALPVEGDPEDAADEFALLMLLGSDQGAIAAVDGVEARYASPASWEYSSDTTVTGGTTLDGDTTFVPPPGAPADSALRLRRATRAACLIYGQNPDGRRALVSDVLTPVEVRRCPAEYQRMKERWSRLLAPHLVESPAVTRWIIPVHLSPGGG